MSSDPSQTLPPDSSMPLAEAVTPERVQALLTGRTPGLLEAPERYGLFMSIVAGITTEVTNIVGPTPTGWVRDSALWAITLGSASLIEESLFPEQQNGDATRAQQLQTRYLGVLADLRRNAPTPDGRGGSVRSVRLSAYGGWR